MRTGAGRSMLTTDTTAPTRRPARSMRRSWIAGVGLNLGGSVQAGGRQEEAAAARLDAEQVVEQGATKLWCTWRSLTLASGVDSTAPSPRATTPSARSAPRPVRTPARTTGRARTRRPRSRPAPMSLPLVTSSTRPGPARAAVPLPRLSDQLSISAPGRSVGCGDSVTQRQAYVARGGGRPVGPLGRRPGAWGLTGRSAHPRRQNAGETRK